jgi:hypothetical protein
VVHAVRVRCRTEGHSFGAYWCCLLGSELACHKPLCTFRWVAFLVYGVKRGRGVRTVQMVSRSSSSCGNILDRLAVLMNIDSYVMYCLCIVCMIKVSYKRQIQTKPRNQAGKHMHTLQRELSPEQTAAEHIDNNRYPLVKVCRWTHARDYHSQGA